MPRKTELPAHGHHIILNDEDWEYLESRYGLRGLKPISVSKLLRKMIHQWVLELREQENRTLDEIRKKETEGARTSGVRCSI